MLIHPDYDFSSVVQEGFEPTKVVGQPSSRLYEPVYHDIEYLLPSEFPLPKGLDMFTFALEWPRPKQAMPKRATKRRRRKSRRRWKDARWGARAPMRDRRLGERLRQSAYAIQLEQEMHVLSILNNPAIYR
jgi:hypothetical protein